MSLAICMCRCIVQCKFTAVVYNNNANGFNNLLLNCDHTIALHVTLFGSCARSESIPCMKQD